MAEWGVKFEALNDMEEMYSGGRDIGYRFEASMGKS
jgi:hypothetical protein